MKKILIGIMILMSFINAQPPIISTDMIYESVGKGIGLVGKGLEANARYLTNTQTEKAKCDSAWWKYFKKSNHIIAVTQKENREIKLLLQKKKINYNSVLKQRVRNVSVDQNELREHSCSEEYFIQLLRQEKRIKEVKIENNVLKELMQLNNIENKKITYYRTKKEPKKEKPKLNMIMTDSADVDKEMKKAMSEVD